MKVRIQLTDPVRYIVDGSGNPEMSRAQDILHKHGFSRLAYEDIDNPYAMPNVNFNRLYIRSDVIYSFYAWEAPSGFMDTITGRLEMDVIGYVIR